MKYWATHTWEDMGLPLVTRHDHAVHLHHAPSEDAAGYSCGFKVAHIPVVEKLLAELIELRERTTVELGKEQKK